MEILPEFRCLQALGILDAHLTADERRAIILVIQQACRHIPLRLVGIEDEKAGSWFYAFRRSAGNANKPFPLDEIPTVEAIDFAEDYSEFPVQMDEWALELGIPLHGREPPTYRNEGWGKLKGLDPKLLGVEVKELRKPPPKLEPWFVELYGREGAYRRGTLGWRSACSW